ncbi:MAG: ABC transporter substrate-binding protein [Chloroflexota bacterium]
MRNHSIREILASASRVSILKIVAAPKSAVCFSLIIGLTSTALAESPEWRTEWRNTVNAAQKEGKVVVSVPASAELRQALEEGFKKQFPGIVQELFPARGSSNINRILEEDKGGIHYFDVHIGGTGSIITGLLPAGLLEPLPSWMILPDVRKPKYWWGGHIWADKAQQYIYLYLAYLTETLWYNTGKLRAEEIKSYDDLLEPKLKGKIEILDPRTAGSGQSTWSFLWKIKGEDFLRKLVRQDLIIGRNQRQLAESLANGKAALSMGLSYYSFSPFLKAGLPIKPLPTPEEGTYASSGSGTVVALRHAPHPNAAKVFVNWLLSREGQEIFSRAMGQPTRRLDVDTAWTKQFGHIAAKDVLTPKRFFGLENQSEEVIKSVRIPAAALARKLLD